MKWMLRLREDTVSEREIADWMQWYEADERHKQAFDEMQRLWHQTGALAEGSEGVARVQRLRKTGVLASALLGHVHRSGRIRLMAAIAACLVLILGVVLTWQHIGAQRLALIPSATSLNPVRTTILPDGSHVDLGAKSSVALQFTRAERKVALQDGEAYFSVTPNRGRPFVVVVGAIRVRAVGTAFNIRRAGERVVVTVDKGLVDVYRVRPDAADETPLQSVRVSAGSEVKWEEGTALPVVTSVDPVGALAWRQGRLQYINEPLSAVIADVNRYSKHPINIRDTSVGHLTFTGTVFASSTDEWLQALPGEFPVDLISDGDSWTLASRPSH